ncbi:MAG TPA: glycosyltransferase family 87 protein, partial [Rhizomicrobium sp.]|nr:glycosyltransferase family 87 protein [Rhizomicrobium sp.]
NFTLMPWKTRLFSPETTMRLCFTVVVSYAAFLAGMFVAHNWMVDAKGHPIDADFIDVWAAGQLVLSHTPQAVYDWHIHRLAELRAIGHEFHGYYGWHYAPPFLFVAALLACVSYVPAYLGFTIATLAAFAATMARIVKRNEAALIACAFPAILLNASVGQNGCLSAALMGASLLLLEERPILSGIFLGLLTYKPQLGILFPFVLALDGRWRAIASASVTAALMMAASWFAFGAQTWRAFFHSIPHTTQAVLVQGQAGFNKLQSVFGLVRWLGGGVDAGWIGQFSVLAIAAIATLWLWRRDVPFALKAAALALSSLLATPYLYVYDFPVLVLTLGFLARQRAFDALEKLAIVAASLSIIIFLGLSVPIGLIAIGLMAWLIARRVMGLADAPAPHVAMQRA